MAYSTDGSSHKNGIKNEKKLSKRLEDKSFAKKLCPSLRGSYKIVQKGGTQYKEDIEIQTTKGSILISAKYKKDISTGSYDHVNSSKALGAKVFDNIKEVSKCISSSRPSKSAARRRFNKCSNDTMKIMESSTLKAILKENVSSKNADKRIVLTDKKTNTMYAWDFKDDPLYNAIENMTPSFDWGRGKTSAKIKFTDDKGKEHQFGLRGRLVSNNGISAMIGKSTKNSISVPVFKVQQDNVKNVIKRIPKNKLVIIKL